MPDYLPGFIEILLASVAAPIVTFLLKRMGPDALSGLGVPINSAVALALYAAAWWLAGAERVELGGYAVAWVASALAGANAVALGRRAMPEREGVSE